MLWKKEKKRKEKSMPSGVMKGASVPRSSPRGCQGVYRWLCVLCLQVDQLLEYHFEEDMTRLTQHCGKKLKGGRQTIIVSATLKDKVPSPPNCCRYP